MRFTLLKRIRIRIIPVSYTHLDVYKRQEYAVPPKVVFVADQYEINQALLNEEKEITLLIGSSNDREVALEKDIQFILASFPMSERLIFNRTYAGYRGSLTFTEDLYDNL